MTKEETEKEIVAILHRLKDSWGIAEIKLRGYILDLKQELADTQSDLDGMKQNWQDAKEERDRLREALEMALKSWRHMVNAGLPFDNEWRSVFKDLWANVVDENDAQAASSEGEKA